MPIFKKEEKLPAVQETITEGASVWVVSWNSLQGRWEDRPGLVSDKRVAKAFVNKDDAEQFKETLKKCMEILQCTFYINIEMEEQK